MKRICSIVVAAVLLIGLLPITEASASFFGELTYTVSDGEATVTDYSTDISGVLKLPATVEGYPITAIAGEAFMGCSTLTGVILPESVTSIGTHAFAGCSSLKEITLPSGVTKVAPYLFAECTALKKVSLPSGVTEIGASAFTGSGLQTITLPSGLTSIGGYAFSLSGLREITLPAGINTINDYTFWNCSRLERITVNGALFRIGYRAFEGCTGLTRLEITDLKAWCETQLYHHFSNPLYYAKSLYLNGELVTDPIIPSGTDGIWNYSFINCTLRSVTIPADLPYIGEAAFYGSGLTEVYYSGTETERAALTVAAQNTPLTDAKWHYEACLAKTKHRYEGCSFACADCGRLRTEAHQYAEGADRCSLCGVTKASLLTFLYTSDNKVANLIGCDPSLTHVSVPDYVLHEGALYTVSIVQEAFANDTRVESVILPETVTLLVHAFYGSSVKEVTLPRSLTKIFHHTFNDCSGLTDIFFRGTETERNAVEIGENNDPLMAATWYYESCIGSATHTYDNACDSACSICGAIREVPIQLGDVNGDGATNTADVVSLIRAVSGSASSTYVSQSADHNQDGKVDMTDVISLLISITQ